MTPPHRPPGSSAIGALLLIAVIVAGVVTAFAYSAGWLSPQRLTPVKLVAALAPPDGPALGRRRNHVIGICFTGVFEANGAGAALSKAPMFARGQYPVVGRFNLGTANPKAPDGSVAIRGIGLQIAAPGEEIWRSAMINAPVFPVSTPRDFYQLLLAKTPEEKKAFAAAHPEFAVFGAWAKGEPRTGSWAEERYNSLDTFAFTNASHQRRIVRWSLVPEAHPVPVAPEALAKLPPDFLQQEIVQRIRGGPFRWRMMVTVSAPGDPTADPTKAWPENRRTVDVGTLVVQQIQPDRSGPCRDINFDPAVLPTGMATSDDPFPAARSAAYRRSYDLRTAEEKDYPRTGPEAE